LDAIFMSTDTWERVYTINKYYDGPELGVADYLGKPHIYEKQFDQESDDYSNRFLLSPIDPELLSWVLEDWDIWLRWNDAYRAGKVEVKTHPALPTERSRHDELSQLIGNRLKPDTQHGFQKWAMFSSRGVPWSVGVQWLDSPAETS
jgi:hypothetical protein